MQKLLIVLAITFCSNNVHSLENEATSSIALPTHDELLMSQVLNEQPQRSCLFASTARKTATIEDLQKQWRVNVNCSMDNALDLDQALASSRFTI